MNKIDAELSPAEVEGLEACRAAHVAARLLEMERNTTAIDAAYQAEKTRNNKRERDLDADLTYACAREWAWRKAYRNARFWKWWWFGCTVVVGIALAWMAIRGHR